MAENVSSDALFHFTKSMKNIKSILKHGFFPHYCLEYTFDSLDRKAIAKRRSPNCAVPIVCFCDLPLSLIQKHQKRYGPYGIGLDKKWGLRNHVSPVLYTHHLARTRQAVMQLIRQEAKVNKQNLGNDLKQLAAYTKPFEGPAWRKRKIERKVQFYDEREWRYVAVTRSDESLFLNRKDYNNKAKRAKLHAHLKKQNALSITPNAIQYLIVPYDKKEKNILKLHDYIMKLYRRQDAILVSTAIMTDDRIKKDV